jgi:hypothetical protein
VVDGDERITTIDASSSPGHDSIVDHQRWTITGPRWIQDRRLTEETSMIFNSRRDRQPR